jgi:type II secretory pathway component PulF
MRISARYRSEAYHSAATTLSAGVPIVRAMDTAARTSRGSMAVAMKLLAQSVEKGRSIGETIAEHRRFFPRLDERLLTAADESGTLAETFGQLSQWYQFRDRTGRTIRSGLFLPVMIFHAAALVAPLPGIFLDGGTVGDYLAGVATILAAGYLPALLVVALIRWTPAGGAIRTAIDHVAIHVPVLGGAIRALALSRFSYALHMLTRAGVPIAQATRQAAEVAGNAAIAGSLASGALSAEAGDPVWQGFGKGLSHEFRAAFEVGEESGKLDQTTERLARQHAEQAENRLADLARWVPRIVYVCVMIMMVFMILQGIQLIAGQIGSLM